MSTLLSYFNKIGNKKSTVRSEKDDEVSHNKVPKKRHLIIESSDESDEEWTLNGASVNESCSIITPSSSSTSTTPSSRSTATTPSSRSTATTPSSRSTATTPSSRSTATTPSSRRTATTPSSRSTATTPSSHSTATTPSSRRTATTPSSRRTATTPSSRSTATTPSAARSPINTPSRKRVKLSDSQSSFPHDTLIWLQKDHLKDKSGNGFNHPDYNRRTLQVPQTYFKKLTPGFQQWWTIKSDHFDSVVMFKVGKFYELYHMDAVIGVRELGLVFMKAEFAHCGFPETGFGRYSDVLVQKGYKVVRVEQMETPAMLDQRIKKMGVSTKSDRVVHREVCSVITKGTRTLNFFGGDSIDGESMFLLALKESSLDSGFSEYGVCFLDTCVGTFHIGQFEDDRQSSRLRTLLAHYPPAQLLYERRNLSSHTNHVIDLLLPTSIKEPLASGTEFWSSDKAIDILSGEDCFLGEDGNVKWPPILKTLLNVGSDASFAGRYDLAISSLGACMWYLKRAHIDHSILSLNSYQLYKPLDIGAPSQGPSDGLESFGQRCILDDVTLANLDIVGTPGHLAGTLLEAIDHTVTSFGKRLLRCWVCAPLLSPTAICSRQGAIQLLVDNPLLVSQAKAVLRKLPDLERLLRKIHSLGCLSKAKHHPDSRAIFFDHVIYNRKKIADFISILDGLQLSLSLLDIFKPFLKSSDSPLLYKLLTIGEGGRFPDLEKQLDFYKTSFDAAKAKDEGVIIPRHGVNKDFDTSHEEVVTLLNKLEQYLREQKRRLGCQMLTYCGTGRNRFQIEVPMNILSKHKIEEYEMTSQRKGFRRFRTPSINALIKTLVAAEEKKDRALRDTMGDLFFSFDQHFSLWENAVQCLAVLDVLLSLATYSGSSSEQMCQPEVSATEKEHTTPYLEVLGGRYPCQARTHYGGDFIPNDLIIKGSKSCLLVTGPNMGGKSTLMRQTGLLVVLAQLGCYVPATKLKWSPVDRVFTRMGASDRIMARESTFLLELKETSSILQHSTRHSLVLVDELGRGTATYDGAAIATAVVQQLAESIKCRTLFSTHYHFLVDQFVENPHVQLGHMACMVRELEEEESITFLYKLSEGACPNSYGFNVAQMAGLPKSVIALAKRKAILCQKDSEQIRMLRQLLQPDFSIPDFKNTYCS